MLRIDVHGTLARHFDPAAPAGIPSGRYPGIDIYMSENDRFVDLVREGFDCVVRVGDLQDSDMIARRIAVLAQVTLAAPDYLRRCGAPARPEALDGHRMVGFRSNASGALLPLEFGPQEPVREVTLPASLSVNGAGELCRGGAPWPRRDPDSALPCGVDPPRARWSRSSPVSRHPRAGFTALPPKPPTLPPPPCLPELDEGYHVAL